jgi:hypothetical protein
MAHLGQDLKLHECLVGEHPPELNKLKLSARGHLPLLLHDEHVIGESRVIMEHLAETYGFENAYPGNAMTRSLHRYAMALVDEYWAPALYQHGDEVSAPLIDTCSALEAAIKQVSPPHPQTNLLALHVAPLWRIFRVYLPPNVITRSITDRPLLQAWLDKIINLPCIKATASSAEIMLEDANRAKQLGLL